MLTNNKNVKFLTEEIEAVYSDLMEHLETGKERNDGYRLADLINIDEVFVKTKSDQLITLLKQVKALKKFNAKERS